MSKIDYQSKIDNLDCALQVVASIQAKIMIYRLTINDLSELECDLSNDSLQDQIENLSQLISDISFT
jgi:hypothetical protein